MRPTLIPFVAEGRSPRVNVAAVGPVEQCGGYQRDVRSGPGTASLGTVALIAAANPISPQQRAKRWPAGVAARSDQ